jgi:hypothetical protein
MRTQGLIGTVLMAAGGMCPLVHVTFIGNWNYFGIDKSFGIIFYLIVLLGLLGATLNKTKLMRSSGWAALLLVILTLAAVWFKSHNYFTFLHFTKLINIAAEMVKYKWGWFIILSGALALLTVKKQAGRSAVTVSKL